MMSNRHKAPMVRLAPNRERILEALLYLISEAERRDIEVTQYSLVKALFLADKSHLNRFGRPITFDNYVAMENGPVPSFAYSLLRHAINFQKVYGLRAPPWDRREAPEISRNAFRFTRARRQPNLDVLSESDIEALSDALTVVSRLSFAQLRKLTHEDPAYVAAWEEGGTKRAYSISYGLLFDVPDFDQADSVAVASKHG